MTTPMFVVDSFTNKAFSGNPAAVCLIESYIDQHDPNVENFLSYPSTLLQKIAKEVSFDTECEPYVSRSQMNLSETAFVWPKKIRDIQGDLSSSTTHYDLRWFTPTVEGDIDRSFARTHGKSSSLRSRHAGHSECLIQRVG